MLRFKISVAQAPILLHLTISAVPQAGQHTLQIMQLLLGLPNFSGLIPPVCLNFDDLVLLNSYHKPAAI